MKKLAFILLVTVLSVGCRSVKNTVKVDHQLEINSDSSDSTTLTSVSETVAEESSSDSLNIDVVTDVQTEINESDSVHVVETITEYSDPDSLGNQHPTRVINRETTRVKNTGTKQSDNSKTNVNSKSENNTTVADRDSISASDASKSTLSKSEELNTEESTKKVYAKWWFWVLVILGVGVVLYFKNNSFKVFINWVYKWLIK